MQKYFATTSLGIEPMLEKELLAIGAKGIVPSHGGVYFEGDQEVLYRANLWCRTPTRIFVPLREFSAGSQVMLYDQIKRMKWENYLNPQKTFAVDCVISKAARKNEMLTHSHFVALKIKDAIVDRLREKFGSRPDIDTENPDLKIHAYLQGTKCILSLDSSGASLHERGYRKDGAIAPMKENLAAALILFSEWDGKVPFYDPMCGSGTLAIEAAMMARQQAPGLSRKYFGFMGFPDFNKDLWRKLVLDAKDRMDSKPKPLIYASDMSGRMLETAKKNAHIAGVDKMITFFQSSIEKTSAPNVQTPGVVIVNPPYGERLGATDDLVAFYKGIGDVFKQRMKNWTAFVFTGNLEAAKFLGLKPSQKIPLFNGAIECRMFKYKLY